MRKWLIPDQSRPVQDCQSVVRSSPTFPLDWTGLSPTPDRDRLDWWNHCVSLSMSLGVVSQFGDFQCISDLIRGLRLTITSWQVASSD